MPGNGYYNYLWNKKRINQDNIEFFLVDSFRRKQDIQQMTEILVKMQQAFSQLLQISEKEAEAIIMKTLARMGSIRFDEKDCQIAPMSDIYNSLTENGKYTLQDKLHYGLTKHAEDRALAVMLNPDFHDADKELGTVHTFVHEFLHVASDWVKDGRCNTGIWQKNNDLNNTKEDLYEGLNEGINERITQLMMQKMYTEQEIALKYSDLIPDPLTGELQKQKIDLNRYKIRVDVVKFLFNKLPNVSMRDFCLNYVNGNDEALMEALQPLKPTLDKLNQQGIYVSADYSDLNQWSGQQIKDSFMQIPEKRIII